MTGLAIHPLTPDRWDDFVALFETDSICRMCWCVHHRLSAELRRETDPKSRKTAMAQDREEGARCPASSPIAAMRPSAGSPSRRVRRRRTGTPAARPPPRSARSMRDDQSIWAATCFFVRKDARGEGVTSRPARCRHRLREETRRNERRSLPDGARGPAVDHRPVRWPQARLRPRRLRHRDRTQARTAADAAGPRRESQPKRNPRLPKSLRLTRKRARDEVPRPVQGVCEVRRGRRWMRLVPAREVHPVRRA